MKKFLSILSWFIGIPLSIVILFMLLGFLAVRFDFWPPNCGVLPINQANRVCEFSKIDSSPKGRVAKYNFWVTVPSGINDNPSLVIGVNSPIALKKAGINSYVTESPVELKTGDIVSYYYKFNDGNSPEKTFKVTRLEKNVYDFVNTIGEKKFTTETRIIPGVSMFDTWSINYNFNFFEDTRRNIDKSLDRIRDMGAAEIGVFSFIEMYGKKNDFVVQEVESAYKYMRDKAISGSEMVDLSKKAHKRGISVVIHYNIEADYTQYFNVKDINLIGKGVGGDAAEQNAAKDYGRDDPKDKEYIDRYFNQLQTTLVVWAKNAEKAGIDGFDITPQYRPPKLINQNEYADKKFSEIIKAIREVYHGKVYASNFGQFGGFIEPYVPEYIKETDGVYVYLPQLNVPSGSALVTMVNAYRSYADRAYVALSPYNKNIILVVSHGSYSGVSQGKAGTEWNDWAEVDQKGYVEDWQAQAEAYDAMLIALASDTRFVGLQSGGYWWDDFMAPRYMDPRNNLHSTIRNKPAEAVWQKYFSSTR